jgi:cytochrome c biogenesis protein CcmG, thiol:disulfide interchange protein DsbE
MAKLIRFVPILIFVVIAGTLGWSLTNDPQKMPSMMIDRPVPDFALPSVQPGGAGLSTADFQGKVVLLNVFSSKCVMCEVEHPTLLELAKNPAFSLFGMDWRDDPEGRNRWLARHKSPYQRMGDDQSGRAGIDFGVTATPETFIIDRTGRIRYRHAGPITPEVWVEVFEPLLAHINTERGG